ncbi:hypothetical protein FACS1894201_01180 [Bacteroidia bacterium]|nr:hypothetical protein FACS1894201_01180 [Bacteroidia bacterium]
MCALTGFAQTATTDPGVVINGVTWATRNVDAPGTFAATPESAGKLYQWNRKKAWAATGTVTGWDQSTPSGTTWTAANDPSPAGWHVPTVDEMLTLLDTSKVSNVWITQNGVRGRKFADKSSGNSIFLPIAGYRDILSGMLYGSDMHGNYWSSTQEDIYTAYQWFFGSHDIGWIRNNRKSGHSVRCVLYVATAVTPPTVTTLDATNITHATATLNKSVTAGSETIIALGFRYRESSESSWTISTSDNITGLTANTQYEFYAYAVTASGTTNGSTLTFTTAAATIVSITLTELLGNAIAIPYSSPLSFSQNGFLGDSAPVEGNSALSFRNSGGTYYAAAYRIDLPAGDSIKISHVEIGNIDPYLYLYKYNGTNYVFVASDDDSYGSYNSYIAHTITGAGVYYIVATTYSQNTTGAYTLNVWSTSPTTPPTVTTLAATNITQTTATLNKSVTAGSETITAQGFKYKQSSASSWATSATGNITGLTAGTQYQFYAYATTATGTINGDTLTFTTSSATGIAESSSVQLSIYPNPVVNGELIVENGELKAGDKIEIYTVNGVLVGARHALPLQGGTITIDISHLPAGEYIVKVGGSAGSPTRTAKVVKK